MSGVEKLFLSVLGMSGTASVVILVVLLARLALRSTSRASSTIRMTTDAVPLMLNTVKNSFSTPFTPCSRR